MRSLGVQGEGKDKYDNVRIGINGRMDTLQAAILLEKLAIFPDEIVGRNRVAARYDELLPADFKRPVLAEGASSVWAQYTVRTSERDVWLKRLKAQGVPAMVYYPRPLHRQAADQGFPIAREHLAATAGLAPTRLSLSVPP